MSLGELLVEVWKRALLDQVDSFEIERQRCRVGRTRGQGLRTVVVSYGGHILEGIEQNPLTSSQWAKLAQAGHRIMQFRTQGRYVGNVCDGELRRYPAWSASGLPE